MDEIKESFRPQKKKKRQINHVAMKKVMITQKFPPAKNRKVFKSSLIQNNSKKRLIIKYFARQCLEQRRCLFLRKMILVELQLGLRKPIFKAKESPSITQLRHLIDSAGFLPKILQFLLINPFSIKIIAKIFNVDLNTFDFFIANNKFLYEFLEQVNKIVCEEYAIKSRKERKELQLNYILTDLLRKNIIQKKKKHYLGNQKYMSLFGKYAKWPTESKKLKKRSYTKIRSKSIKYIISKLNKKILRQKLQKRAKNKHLMMIFHLLDELKNKNTHIKNAQKGLDGKKITNNPLAFFYNKHIKEIEKYCLIK